MDSNSKIDELLNIAKKEDTRDGYKKLSSVEKFILEFKVVESDKPETPGQLIYWAYWKWCKLNKKRPVKRNPFFAEFQKRFKRYNASRMKTYYVDITPFAVDESGWWEMRNHYRMEVKMEKMRAKKKQKRKEKKKPSQTSGSQEAL